VRILEIVKASKEIEGKASNCSVNEVGALGVLKDLVKGGFYCSCRQWGKGRVVVKMLTNSRNRNKGLCMSMSGSCVWILWLRLGFKGFVYCSSWSVVSCMFNDFHLQPKGFVLVQSAVCIPLNTYPQMPGTDLKHLKGQS